MTALTELSGSNPEPKPNDKMLEQNVHMPEHDSPDDTVSGQNTADMPSWWC